MFFASWDDRASLVIDVDDDDDARRIATEIAEGSAPKRLIDMPRGLFVAEVFYDDDEALVTEPIDSALTALEELHDVDEGDVEEEGDEEEDDDEGVACGANAIDDEGNPVACDLDEGHEDDGRDHEADSPTGKRVVWGIA